MKGAVGMAAMGGVGGLVAEATASPAAAGTTVQSVAVAPTVVFLVDAPTITVNAALGNDFRVTIGASRNMGNPSNPTDGQQIIFQITQGTAGPFTITWGSDYEFSTGLPQPTLSTTAGQTDVLGFVYNAAMGEWLLVSFVRGFAPAASASPSPSPTPTPTTSSSPPPTGTYRLFPSTSGPASPVSYTGPFLCGVAFEVTSYCWLTGYWWWVCDSAQSTSAQMFTLWQVASEFSGAVVAGATVTSSPLVAGQWNYVALSTPLPLSQNTPYIAATGFSNCFPITNGQFGSGDPYGAGITNGPLTAYSDQSGSKAGPYTIAQGVFGTAGTDPTLNMPADGSGSANFWMDLQVTTSPPAGTSYRIWPAQPIPYPAQAVSIDTGQQTFGTEFVLSQPCTLDNIWFYSPPGVTVLPSQCAIWNVATQQVVAGTNNTAPSWSGAAGSGWVACRYSGVTLPAGDYKTTVFSGGGSEIYMESVLYFSSGPGQNGLSGGPLTCPNTASATAPGNSTYQDGPFSYPDSFDSHDDGENRWVDVEVTPV